MKGIKGVELCVGEMFSAPELFGCTVGFASDMWSLGVVFAHLLQTPEEREVRTKFAKFTNSLINYNIVHACTNRIYPCSQLMMRMPF